jgi:hypothetical protein
MAQYYLRARAYRGRVLGQLWQRLTSVAAQGNNPVADVLAKLDQILSAGNHTLRWDTNNPSASRFVTVFTGAVLDKNTGLVWEQAPDPMPRTWFNARILCANKNVGGTVGWRLPSAIELKSVQDPSLPPPFVPVSVFTGVQLFQYWTTTATADAPGRAWFVGFGTSSVEITFRSGDSYYWCVRGGTQESVY